MLYSSGIHGAMESEAGLLSVLEGKDFDARESELRRSQLAKIDALIRRAQIGSSDTVLEIGCGWGATACRVAATTGARVVGITISREQLAEGRARVQKEGLSHLVTLEYCDYRKAVSGTPNGDPTTRDGALAAEGSFDKVISIEITLTPPPTP